MCYFPLLQLQYAGVVSQWVELLSGGRSRLTAVVIRMLASAPYCEAILCLDIVTCAIPNNVPISKIVQ